MDQRLEKASRALLERQHLMQNLNSILPAVSEKGEIKNPLYLESIGKEKEPSLIVYFDHGIDPDPAFSGQCLARIYLDEEHNLKLAIWPEKREKALVREQILLPNIGAFSFRFLTKKSNGSIVWDSKRSKDENTPLPSAVRLDLWQQEAEKEEPLSFAFFLPSKYPPIVYSNHRKKK